MEENNGSHIRAYVGCNRFDSVAQVKALNTLYPLLDLHLFQPLMDRQEDGSYAVTTPLDHLLETHIWDKSMAQAWQTCRDHIDLLTLRLAIVDALHALAEAPAAPPDTTRRCTANPWAVENGDNPPLWFGLPTVFHSPYYDGGYSLFSPERRRFAQSASVTFSFGGYLPLR